MKRLLISLVLISTFVLMSGPQSLAAPPLTSVSPTGVTPPTGHVSVQASHFGLDYVYPLDSRYRDEKWPQLFSQIGVKWVNFADVSWKAIEPFKPNETENKVVHHYYWNRLDKAVEVWQKYGFQITISLRLRNGWFAGEIKYRPNEDIEYRDSDRLPAPEYIGYYQDWIRALVERYDGDGVDDMPGLRYPILYYQVGNEYANPAFWTGTPEDYVTLLELTREAAREASPNVYIISNGIRWNDAFHNDPNAEHFEETFAAFLEGLPSDVWREVWQRAREITELTVALADRYDILDAGGNGPYETSSAGYMAWVQKELDKHGLTTTIWDMEARSEPRLTYNELVQFHPELTVPDGQKILCVMKMPNLCANDEYPYEDVVAWYRAEQSRVLVKVFVTRFAAGFEKVFMGMPDDWNRSWAALSVRNPFIGLTDTDGNPWPAFYALKLLVDKLDGFVSAEKVEGEASFVDTVDDDVAAAVPGIEVYRFTFNDGRSPVWVAWLSESQTRGMHDPLVTRKVRLNISAPVTLYTIPTTGDTYETMELEAGPDGLVVDLSPEPVLLEEH